MNWLRDGRIGGDMKGNSPVRKVNSLELFSDQLVEELTKSLAKIDLITRISWEFNEERGLLITGIDPEVETVVLGHPNSARAYLDAYLLGYDHGYGDAREESNGGN